MKKTTAKSRSITVDTSTAGLTNAAKLLARHAGKTIKELKAAGVAAATLKALRKARLERKTARRLRRMERTETAKLNPKAAKGKAAPKAAEPAPAQTPSPAFLRAKPERASKPGKRSRKIRKAHVAEGGGDRPTDATVAAFRKAGGKVTRVPNGQRAMVPGEAAQRVKGNIPASEPAGSEAARETVDDLRELELMDAE